MKKHTSVIVIRIEGPVKQNAVFPNSVPMSDDEFHTQVKTDPHLIFLFLIEFVTEIGVARHWVTGAVDVVAVLVGYVSP